jgi:hypothetical protein
MTTTLPLQTGDPITHRGLTVVPIFPRRTPIADYTTLEDAVRCGFRITEISELGSVPELLATNPLPHNVLLYDGEELIGAKQNRILNLTVLVPAHSQTRLPVSCVEAGRWHTRSAAFRPASHTAGPELRLRKARTLAANPTALGAAQSEVWDAVADKATRLGVDSPTEAHDDLFTRHSPAVRKLASAFPCQPGQSGMALLLPDGRACLDYLSRPKAYALQHTKLLDGYLLDGMEQIDRPAASVDVIERMLEGLGRTKPRRRASAGLGVDVRLQVAALVGSGLELDAELLQLSAYASASSL